MIDYTDLFAAQNLDGTPEKILAYAAGHCLWAEDKTIIDHVRTLDEWGSVGAAAIEGAWDDIEAYLSQFDYFNPETGEPVTDPFLMTQPEELDVGVIGCIYLSVSRTDDTPVVNICGNEPRDE